MFIPEISCLSGKFMNTKLVCNFQNTVAEMLRTRITTKGQQGLLTWNYEEADLKLNSQVTKMPSLGTDGPGASKS